MIHGGSMRGGAQRRGPMGGGPMAMMKGERAHDFKGTMRKLFSYLGRYRLSLIISLVIAGASTVFSIVGPKILGNATTELFNGVKAMYSGTGSIDFTAIGNILLQVAG